MPYSWLRRRAVLTSLEKPQSVKSGLGSAYSRNNVGSFTRDLAQVPPLFSSRSEGGDMKLRP